MGDNIRPEVGDTRTGADLLSRPKVSQFFLLLLGLVDVVLLPFALTLPYSSLSHRDIATDLSFPAVTDTRLFIAVVAAVAWVIAAIPGQFGSTSNPVKKAALAAFGALLVLITMNAASALVRGGPSNGACGFPFAFRKWDIQNGSSDDHAAMWADIVIASLVSVFLAVAQVQFVRRTQRLKRVGVMLSLASAIYVGLFSYWWLTSKRGSVVQDGVIVRQVELHQPEVMYLTQPMWEPAFWFVERVCGYHYVGYIAAMEESAFGFEK